MSELKLNGFVTFDIKNVRYLTGFTGSSGAAVITQKAATFITDFRYASQVKEQVKSMKKEISRSLHEGAAKALAKTKRVGYEEGNLTVADLRKLKKSVKAKWTAVKIVEELRLIKDRTEIKLIEKNMKLMERAFYPINQIIFAGKQERKVAARLEYLLRFFGGDGPAFDFIVASGKRSALPHGVASEKKIGKNDVIILDWGCLMDGYHTDNTRTFFVGKPKKKLKEIFHIVLEANLRAIDKIAPGVPLREIDASARDFIKKSGYGDKFGHGTGHGVGLNVHEAPSVNPLSKDVAEEGMVFTIEPGIYLPGIGGVRIEDMIVVTKRGCRVLSQKLPKEFRIL